jgi:hypothetical protein
LITDDEVMRVLEQANPASVDDPIPMFDVAGYRDVLDARNTTMTLTDNEPSMSEPSSGRRGLILTAAAAAAVVVAIVVVATRNDDATPTDQPSPNVSVSVSPTPPPRPLLGAALYNEQLVPGTYFIDEVDGIATPRIFVTVGAGWSGSGSGVSLSKDGRTDNGIGDGGRIAFRRPTNVFSDACHWKDGDRPGGRATTVDGFVAALTEQGGWADVTTPSEISIDGYAGKAFRRTAPTDILACDTLGGTGTPSQQDGLRPSFGGDRPGDIETVWVLDVDGTVVVIEAKEYPEASAAARAEIAAVLDSIRIERP